MPRLSTIIFGVGIVVVAVILIVVVTNSGGDGENRTVDMAAVMTLPDDVAPDIIIGDPDAPVTVIEYASMTCPHCAAFHADSYPELKERFIDTGQANLIVREYSRDDFDLAAFMLARCVPEANRIDFMGVLFERQADWYNVPGGLQQIALGNGMSQDMLEACLTNGELEDQIQATTARAQAEFEVTGTPTFIVSGEVFQGNVGIGPLAEAIEAGQ
jgi:protein-disulfide isomerase